MTLTVPVASLARFQSTFPFPDLDKAKFVKSNAKGGVLWLLVFGSPVTLPDPTTLPGRLFSPATTLPCSEAPPPCPDLFETEMCSSRSSSSSAASALTRSACLKNNDSTWEGKGFRRGFVLMPSNDLFCLSLSNKNGMDLMSTAS